MYIRIRPFEDSDHDANARAFTEVFPDFPLSADDSRRVDASRKNRTSVVAESRRDGRAVAFGSVWQDLHMNYPGKYWIWVLVEPVCQGRGIGSKVYRHLMEKLSKVGAVTAWANARDDRPRHMEFVRRRGFRELWRNINQRLSVGHVDLDRKHQLTAQASEQGIAIVTLSEEARRNPDYLRCLHQLHNLIQMDVPRAGYFTPVSYEEFALEFRRGTHLPDGYFIAKEGERYIGLSYLQAMNGDPDTVEVGLTGVRREYRRRGIAAALKLHTLGFAKERGFRTIETGNDSKNEPILALNESVGFRRVYAWVTFEKQLGLRGTAGGFSADTPAENEPAGNQRDGGRD